MNFIIFLFINLFYTYNYTTPEKDACNPLYPFMSVGDYNISKANFDSYLSKNDFVILVISSSSCKECCQFEETYAKMNEFVFKNKTLHNIDYKMARINLLTNLWIKTDINFNYLPYFTFYYKKKHHYLLNPNDPFRIHNQVQRIIKSFSIINSWNEFKEFIIQDYDKKKYYKRIIRKLCVGFFYDLEDLDSRYNEFIEVADTLSWREDLRLVIVKDKKVIKEIYNEYKNKFFDDDELNGVLLISKQNDFETKDSIYKVNFDNIRESILKYFVERSIESIEEITSYNSQVIMSTSKPIIFAFLNQDELLNSENFIEIYKSVQVMYEYKAHFVWLYFHKNIKKAKDLGLLKCNAYPCIIIEQRKPEKKNYIFPIDKERSKQNLVWFFNNYFYRGLDDSYIIDSSKLNTNIDSFKKNLGHIIDLNYYSFLHTVLKGNNNNIVYFVDLKKNDGTKKSIKMLNTIKLFFKKVKNSNLDVGFYDLGFEKELSQFKLDYKKIEGKIIYFPKDNKKNYKIFENNLLKGFDIVQYILINSNDIVVSKNIEVNEDEKQEGITIQKLFEGDEEL